MKKSVDPIAENNAGIRRRIRGKLAYNDLSVAEIAPIVGLTPYTVGKRLANPETMTIAEFRRLIRAVGYKNGDVGDILSCINPFETVDAEKG